MSENGLWNDLSNTGIINNNCGFICEYENPINSNNYKSKKTITFNNSTYEFYDNVVTWEQANEICKLKGGNLVTVTTNLENILIQETAKELSLKYIWLCGTDEETESTWKWVSNEDFSYTNWLEGEPNNAIDSENYLEMIVESGKWNDVFNNNGKPYEISYGFVCEYDNTSILGDVNSDGKVSIADVTAIQKYGVEKTTLNDTQLKLADVNKDGRVSITDATTIQKYLIGKAEI